MSLQDSASIKGDFDRETLPTALQYLANNHSAGRLELTRGARRARLYFQGGNLIAAELDNKYGEDVIAQLLTWVNGQFEFYRGEMSEDSFPPAARVQKSISAVLLRAVAQSDALEQAASQPVPKITAASVPVLEISEGGSAVQLDAGTWRLMSKVDGVRSVAQIAEALGLSLETIAAQLSATTLATLSEPRFRCGVDESFGSGTAWLTDPMPIFAADGVMTFDGELTIGTDVEAEEALHEVRTAIGRARTSVTLAAGDLLVVDNRRAVHGRSPFTARFDGTDRWLQRTFVVDKLPPAIERNGRVISTRFA